MATVLVIENDATTRQLIGEIVGECGHDIWQAANGEEGLMLAHLLLPDLVITDIVMPVKDGFVTIVELQEAFGGVKIIAMSAHPDKLKVALRLGVQDVFLKPFNPRKLGEAVQEALQA